MRRALGFLLLPSALTVGACGVDVDDLFGNPSGTDATSGTGAAGTTSTAGPHTASTGTPSTATTTATSTVTSAVDVVSVTSTTVTTSTGSVDPVGCSDGTREYFTDMGAQPNIAGCDAGFDVAGVSTPESASPQCNRVSGNDSTNPAGTDCSVEDACSEGWHACHGADDVASHSATGECESTVPINQVFYITHQVQDTAGNCTAPPDTNNITGCGTLGDPPVGENCSPLTNRMRTYECAPTAAWYCGNMNSNGDNGKEAELVQKLSSDEGGVLCCKD